MRLVHSTSSCRFTWVAASSLALILSCSSKQQSSPGGQPMAGSGSGGTQSTPPPTGGSAGEASGGSEGSLGGTGGAGEGGTSSAAGGTAGVPGASGGSAGAGGQGGGQAGATAEVAVPSMGCGQQPDIVPGTFVSGTSAERLTYVRLPTDYNPERAYPLIFVWKGCSTAGVSTFGLQNIAGADAIIAQGDFAVGQECYDTADGSTFTDLPVFDALLEQIETKYCVDKAHVFSVGFSSGAWLTQLLACQRGDVLRGIGTIAGAFKPAFLNGAAACVGDGLSAFLVSDLDDHSNPFYDEDNDGDSVEVAVNHWLTANGCGETTWSMQAGTPTGPDEAVCRAYAGCGADPVTLCLTSGKGHAAQESLSMPGIWGMFQSLLPK